MAVPRTEVYQLRLTSAEKGDLARQARAEGLSIAQMIRRRFGLAKGVMPSERTNFDREAEADRTVRGEAQESAQVPTRLDPQPSAFEQRVNELSRLMPRPNAERVARREQSLLKSPTR